MSNAMLFPAVTKFSVSGAPERYARLGREMGVASDEDDEKASQRLVELLESLNSDLHVETPKDCGIGAADYEKVLEKMASDALASGSPNNNPVVPSAEEIVRIYREAY